MYTTVCVIDWAHTNYDSYICLRQKSEGINYVPEAEKCGMMKKIKSMMLRLTNNASSIIEHINYNLCEQFNSIINK